MGKFHLRFLNVSVESSALWHLKLTIYRFFRMEFSWKLFYSGFLYKTLNSHMLAHCSRCCWNCGKDLSTKLRYYWVFALKPSHFCLWCSFLCIVRCVEKRNIWYSISLILKIWISMYILSSLFSVHLLWCWWAEFVKQLRLSYYWTFPLFSYPLCLIKQWYHKE